MGIFPKKIITSQKKMKIFPKKIINSQNKIENYTHYIELPLKLVSCWDFFLNPKHDWQIIINNVYLCLVLFVLLNPLVFVVNLYFECVDMMWALDKFSDTLPYIASLFIVIYFTTNRPKLYALQKYMNENFKYFSARGLTNMTMWDSYQAAKNFAYMYTACTLTSSWMYVFVPLTMYRFKNVPLQSWYYMDLTQTPYMVIAVLRQLLAQTIMGLALGQLGVFFASNSILLCGQLDVLCCSLRNARLTALLRKGVQHADLKNFVQEIKNNEEHNFIYNRTEIKDSMHHYNNNEKTYFKERKQYDIYSSEFDEATYEALQECAKLCQVVSKFRVMFEEFISPMLVLRVIQVTLYLCTLLYAASRKFDMVTVEYLLAVAFDIFIYCYYGNQIIVQASRVTTAAYQCHWHTMGVRPRRLLLNILVANKRPAVVRAGGFLPMDLNTYVLIIKTSFSYYTLLSSVNEHK